MRSSHRWNLGIALVLLAIAAWVPFMGLSRYVIGEITLALFLATVASQWNLVFGVAGVFSMAQMTIFAVGGYATAMLGLYQGWSLWLAIPAAAVISVLFSILVGLACLRLTGAYVALLTLAVSQVLLQLVLSDTACFSNINGSCVQFTGGASGLTGFGSLGLRQIFHGSWNLADYGIAVVIFVLAMGFSYVVMHSPIGLAFRAIRDNPRYAVARGINRFQIQLLVFGLSAFFTGLAGGFYAAHYENVGPEMLSSYQLLLTIAMVVVGGLGRFWGPVVGAVLLTVIEEFTRDAGQFRMLGLGLVIAAVMIAAPTGVLGLFEQGLHRLRRAFARRDPPLGALAATTSQQPGPASLPPQG